MLKIDHLSVFSSDACIIQDLSLTIAPGSLHLLMGPNGSGKSTLSYALAGHPRYEMRAKDLQFLGHDFHTLSPDKRARMGFFLAVQTPPEIPGVTIVQFLKEAYNACTGQSKSVAEFQQELESYVESLGLHVSFLQRSLHENFSGGEKKRLELLQFLVLKPKLAILDEIDSGLDIDALVLACNTIKLFRKERPQSSLLIITHNPRIVQFLEPEYVHILQKGRLLHSADKHLAYALEQKGYDGLVHR